MSPAPTQKSRLGGGIGRRTVRAGYILQAYAIGENWLDNAPIANIGYSRGVKVSSLCQERRCQGRNYTI